MEVFSNCEEAFAADALFLAYRCVQGGVSAFAVAHALLRGSSAFCCPTNPCRTLNLRSGDEDEVKAFVKSKTLFKQLDNQVARLAVKLPTGKMSRMARKVEEVMGAEEAEGEEGEEGEEDVC